MLTNSIPWDNFSAFFLNSNSLGAEISTKVSNALYGYFSVTRPLLRNFSCLIERIILKLLPVQESYYDAEIRILEEHKQHLLGPNPSIDYTKAYIHLHAQELTTKSSYYKEMSKSITNEQHRVMILNQKTNLLSKIIAHTTYDAQIHELLIASAKYKNITEIPNNELLDNLQNLIQAEAKSAIALVNATKLSLSSTLKQPSDSLVHRCRSLSAGCNNRSFRKQTTLNRSKSCNQPNKQQHNTPSSYSPQLLIPPDYFSRPPPNLSFRPPPNHGQYGQLKRS